MSTFGENTPPTHSLLSSHFTPGTTSSPTPFFSSTTPSWACKVWALYPCLTDCREFSAMVQHFRWKCALGWSVAQKWCLHASFTIAWEISRKKIPFLSVSFKLAGLFYSSSIFQDSLVSVGHFAVNVKTMRNFLNRETSNVLILLFQFQHPALREGWKCLISHRYKSG